MDLLSRGGGSLEDSFFKKEISSGSFCLGLEISRGSLFLGERDL